MRPKCCLSACAAIVFSMCLFSISVFGIAMESGPRKKHAPDEHVYFREINGYELECFNGNAEVLNGYLQKKDNSSYRLVLRPGPSDIKTLVEQTPVPCTWSLEDGTDSIYEAITGRREAFGSGPIVTIYIDEKISLEEIALPSLMKLISPIDEKECYRKALSHEEYEIRAEATGLLATADPHDAESVLLIGELLTDEDDYVRASTASSLSRFGNCAKNALPALRSALAIEPKRKESLQRAIQKIESAPDTSNAEQEFRARFDQIADFVSKVNSAKATEAPGPRELGAQD